MSQLTADFEAGTNGSDVLITDPGSATPWDVRFVSGGALIYSNAHVAHGSLAMKADSSSSGSVKRVSWTTALGGTITDHYGRFYLYVDTLPGSDTFIHEAFLSSVTKFALRLRTNGFYQIFDGAGFAGQSGNALSVGTLYRIEYHVVHNVTTGSTEVKNFVGDSTTPSDTVTLTGRNTGTGADELAYGCCEATTPPWSLWQDDIIGNASSYPGPAGLTVVSGDNTPAVLAALKML